MVQTTVTTVIRSEYALPLCSAVHWLVDIIHWILLEITGQWLTSVKMVWY